MEKPAFTRVNLPNVRVIMTIMRVPVVERLCHAVMGRISTLKCLLLGKCGCLRPCRIKPKI
jgi:hypothetical protein